MFEIVAATFALTSVITSTPQKFSAAAIRIAACGRIARVETHVAIAFGASVQPLTRITPVVNSTVSKKGRFVNSSEKNSCNDSVILSCAPGPKRVPGTIPRETPPLRGAG